MLYSIRRCPKARNISKIFLGSFLRGSLWSSRGWSTASHLRHTPHNLHVCVGYDLPTGGTCRQRWEQRLLHPPLTHMSIVTRFKSTAFPIGTGSFSSFRYVYLHVHEFWANISDSNTQTQKQDCLSKKGKKNNTPLSSSLPLSHHLQEPWEGHGVVFLT